MKKLINKIFNCKPVTDNFFGENDKQSPKVIGLFKEWSYTNSFYREIEITEEDRIFVGAWIAEAKANNHEYNIIWY